MTPKSRVEVGNLQEMSLRPEIKIVSIALALLMASCAGAVAQAPDPGCTSNASVPTQLFVGVTMQTVAFTCPAATAPSTAYVVRVDLTTPGLSFEASAWGSGEKFFNTELVTAFLQRTKSQVAVNANLFTNCCSYTSSVAAGLCGLEISGGQVLSPLRSNQGCDPSFPFDSSLTIAGKSVRIDTLRAVNPIDPALTTAVTGSHLLVSAGLNVAPQDTSPSEFFGPNARSLAGLSAGNDVLWIVAVERAATSGVTLPQAAQLMIQLGAATALNLDGGGSTSLAVDAGDGKVRLLNTPSDSVPNCTFPKDGKCERYVGASFGIRAQPLP